MKIIVPSTVEVDNNNAWMWIEREEKVKKHLKRLDQDFEWALLFNSKCC
jgi:hypothetical protein